MILFTNSQGSKGPGGESGKSDDPLKSSGGSKGGPDELGGESSGDQSEGDDEEGEGGESTAGESLSPGGPGGSKGSGHITH